MITTASIAAGAAMFAIGYLSGVLCGMALASAVLRRRPRGLAQAQDRG